MNILVTGASGFVGSHLVDYLAARANDRIFATVFGSNNALEKTLPEEQVLPLNLMDRQATAEAVGKSQPEWVFHLAALSSPAESFKDPRATFANNIEAEINLLDALKDTNSEATIMIIGSAEEYGKVSSKDIPIDEQTPLLPLSPYAVSKIAQDFLGLQYHLSYGLKIIRVRPFNHTGPRQSPYFVLPAFAKQVAEIEAGRQEPVINVGNLDAIRDFTDVADMVRAYVLAMEKGVPGEVYNIGSGKGTKIADLLNLLLTKAESEITIETDPERLTPSDVPRLICDASKFEAATGWRPELSVEQTVERVLNYWRQQVNTAPITK